jgi:hypothetical protein
MYTYIYITINIYIYILIYIYTSDFPVVKASGCDPTSLQVMPRPDILDFDGFVLRRGAANRGGPVRAPALGGRPWGCSKIHGVFVGKTMP